MIHFGFYQSPRQYAYPDLLRDAWKDQVARGFTTATIDMEDARYFGCDQDDVGFARHLEAMLEIGVVSVDCPVLAVARPQALVRLPKSATRRWPPLLWSSPDEANTHDEAYTEALIVRSKLARDLGLLYGGTLVGHGFTDRHLSKSEGETCLGDWLDLWIASPAHWDEELVRAAKAKGKRLAAYWCFENWPEDAQRLRYLSGLWAWKHRPEFLLFWAYTHQATTRKTPKGGVERAPDDNFSYVLPAVNGPEPTPGYLALAEGIKDCRVLEQLEGSGRGGLWLEGLRGTVLESIRPPTAAAPTAEFDAIREAAKKLLVPESKEPPTPPHRAPTTLESMVRGDHEQ